MQVKWAALGEVFLVGFGVAVSVVLLFTLGVLGLSARATARERGAGGGVGQALAGVCFTACGGVVLYGVYLIAFG
ncbi:hypothetical protein [Streptoalloteichus hindustanus]|uniref:Uncharacterized protein n=1 Tax=Streptoalloteichus hindustanus TaxID=2017 RepID=A0A1M5BVQ7_STRHI|nr:hypothetical protein [Streptoalloteichus hindustanus]SHF46619.1 hypothetical protein SAMN05444320_103755 [Streptoalloteichus hindustanus]